MIKDILVSLFHFIILVFCQIFLLNNIYFLGFINPMLYVWFIILLPFATPNWLVLILSFILGVSVDIFSADAGFNAFICTLTGFIRPMLLNFFSGNVDNVTHTRPSSVSLGVKNFLLFTSSVVLIHHFLYFFISAFSFNEILQILLRSVLSSVVTIGLIILLDMVFFKKNE
ncbi:MAG: hypothetical protein IJ681_10550 [Bacteroidales bacterium]|nr:hypothetical protein [Bacteroidales bacterium]